MSMQRVWDSTNNTYVDTYGDGQTVVKDATTLEVIEHSKAESRLPLSGHNQVTRNGAGEIINFQPRND